MQPAGIRSRVCLSSRLLALALAVGAMLGGSASGAREPLAVDLSPADLERVAFDRSPGVVRMRERAPFVLLTDAAAVGMTGLLALLDAAYQQTRRDFSFLLPPRRHVTLLVFAGGDEFAAFPSRLGVALGLPEASVKGRALVGIGATAFRTSSSVGLSQAVAEGTRALLREMIGIGAGSDWFVEGVVTRSRWTVAPPNRPGLRAAVEDPRTCGSLATLLDGDPVPARRLWQAGLLVQFLLGDPLRRVQLPVLFDAMRRQGSMDARALVGAHLGIDLDAADGAFLT